jgi:hypothetical protein
MIQGQLLTPIVAILTGMAIAFQEIPPSEGNFLIGDFDEMTKTNNSGKGKIGINKMAVMFQLLGFSLKQQNYRSPPTGDVKRFIGGI